MCLWWRRSARPSRAFAEVEETITRAVELAASCQEAYIRAPDPVRRQFNQVLFTHIWVDAGHVTGVELTDEFARILAEDLIKKGFQRERTPALSGVGSTKAPLLGGHGRKEFEPKAD